MQEEKEPIYTTTPDAEKTEKANKTGEVTTVSKSNGQLLEEIDEKLDTLIAAQAAATEEE